MKDKDLDERFRRYIDAIIEHKYMIKKQKVYIDNNLEGVEIKWENNPVGFPVYPNPQMEMLNPFQPNEMKANMYQHLIDQETMLRMQNQMREGDADTRLKKLTDTQRWMFDRYFKNWDELAEEAIQFYQNDVYGVFGTIIAIKPDKDYPIMSQFQIIDTEDQVKWYNLWSFELVRTPKEILVKTKAARLAELEARKGSFEDLKKHKMIDKAYVSGRHLIVVTKPTLAIHRDTGRVIPDMPMGRWVFDINMDSNLNDVHVWNLDFAEIQYGAPVFHYFHCWGGHPGQTLPLFQTGDYFSITDFLINFMNIFPHDGYRDMGTWGRGRIKITAKYDKVVATIHYNFKKRPITQWIVGKPTNDIDKIADLFRKDITIPDKYDQARGKNRKSFVTIKTVKELRIGMIVRAKLETEYTRYFVWEGKDSLGTIIMINDATDIKVYVEERGNEYWFPKDSLLKLKDQVFEEKKDKDLKQGPPGPRYPYEGDDGEGGRAKHNL